MSAHFNLPSVRRRAGAGARCDKTDEAVRRALVQEADPEERRRLLTFVVCGGGPTGVEFAGALAELLDLVVPAEYPELQREECQIHLIEGQERVLSPFHPSLSAYAGRVLEGKGVKLHLGVLVKEAMEAGAVGLAPPGTHCRPAELVSGFDWSRVATADVEMAWDPESGVEVVGGEPE